MRRVLKTANVKNSDACHFLLHSCATHMLKNGADMRSIQHLLGQARLDTTQITTEVTIHQLGEVHAPCHPYGRRVTAASTQPQPSL